MNKILTQFNGEFSFDLKETQELLDFASIQLKSEFIGIDEQIDSLIDNIKPWLFFKDTLTKPLVINLWGMTGCGKTKLVERLIEILKLKNNSYHINGGDLRKQNALNTIIFNHMVKNDHPIIVLDEIQNYKCKNDMGMEYEDYESSYWDFIDTGRLQLTSNAINRGDTLNFSALCSVFETLRVLNYSFYQDINYENCILRLSNENVSTIEDILNRKNNYAPVDFKTIYPNKEPPKKTVIFNENPNIHFVRADNIPHFSYSFYTYLNTTFDKIDVNTYKLKDKIIKNYETLFNLFHIVYENLKEDLIKMNFDELEEFICIVRRNIIEGEASPEVDYSKSLIFVMGNIDEAYYVHKTINPDISADQFHKITKKINIINIKEALRCRFRSEHISRLGNIHIIYPSLSSKSYKEIITKNLKDYSDFIFKQKGIQLFFDKSIHEILYKESVYPTQGVRPIISSINEIIKSKLSTVLLYGMDNNKIFNEVIFSYQRKKIIIDLKYNGDLIDTIKLKHTFKLNDLRKSKNDDRQTLTAIHESGHVILQTVLFKKLPQSVYSVTADTQSNGFMSNDFDDATFINKESVKNHVKVLLGGQAAEEIIFGSDLVTTGSSHDLKMATTYLTHAFRKSGLFSVLGTQTVGYGDDSMVREYDETISKKIEAILQDLYIETKEIIKKEMDLLLILGEYLSNHSTISNKKLKEIVFKHIKSVDMNDLTKVNNNYREIMYSKFNQLKEN